MKSILKATFLAISLLISINTSAQNWNNIAKSVPDSLVQSLPNLKYGKAIAVDGNFAVIGAPGFNGSQGIAFVLFFNGVNWDIQAQLTASEGAPNNHFGYSVGISGDNVVVGAYGDGSGSVYVFTKPGTTWDNMTQTAKLLPSDGSGGDEFGFSVSISGDNVVVGALRDDDNGSASGSTYVFTKPGTTWINMTQTAKLLPDDGSSDDYFGYSVSISGNNVVVGARYANGNVSGSAYVFTKPGTVWSNMVQTAKLIPDDSGFNDKFGLSVSISGDNVVVGAYGDNDNGYDSGSAYVFTKPGTTWSNMIQTAKLLPSDGTSHDYFGYSVSISGDNVLVGAFGDDDNGNSAGSAYVFTKPGATWNSMTQTAKLLPSDGTEYDSFGQSVGISGDNVVVGAFRDDEYGYNSGSSYVFTKRGITWINITETAKQLPPDFISNSGFEYGNVVAVDGNYAVVGGPSFNGNQGIAFVLFFNGANWVIQGKLLASDGAADDHFGKSVSISGDNVVVGAFGDNNSGSAYVFTKSGTMWSNMTQTAKLIPSDGSEGDDFGYSVSISGDNVVVGAYGDDDNGDNSGSAYVFTKPGTMWSDMTQTAKLLSDDGSVNNSFGFSVSISGDNVVVGAYGDGDNGTFSGAGYVFTKPGTSWSNMTQTAKLLPSGGSGNSGFGFSVSISVDNVVVGAYVDTGLGFTFGSAYIFSKSGTTWSNMNQTAKLLTDGVPDAGHFGYSVSISGNNVVVGAYEGDHVDKIGSAYIYTKLGTSWSNMAYSAKLLPYDGVSGDDFGYSVSISGDNLVVGSPVAKVNGIPSGSAYLFQSCFSLSSISAVVCDYYTSPSGKILSSSNTYLDTILNAAGCDSIITIDLTVLPELKGSYTDTVCYGGSIVVNGITYNENNLTSSEVYSNIGPYNCDSTYTITLTILPEKTGTHNATICVGDSIVVNGTTYNENNVSGTEVFSNVGPYNCDSVVTINLTVVSSVDISTSTTSPTISANQTGANYQWLDCDNAYAIIPGETEQSFTALATGNYAVEISVGSCTDTSDCEHVAISGVIDVVPEEISIYPNPTNGWVNIAVGQTMGVIHYTIYSLEGKIIEIGKTTMNTIAVDLSKESTGVYLVHVITEKSSAVHKLMRR